MNDISKLAKPVRKLTSLVRPKYSPGLLLQDDDLSPAEQAEVLALAAELKRTRHTAARSPSCSRPMKKAMPPMALSPSSKH